jgi:hypothetical protein
MVYEVMMKPKNQKRKERKMLQGAWERKSVVDHLPSMCESPEL